MARESPEAVATCLAPCSGRPEVRGGPGPLPSPSRPWSHAWRPPGTAGLWASRVHELARRGERPPPAIGSHAAASGTYPVSLER